MGEVGEEEVGLGVLEDFWVVVSGEDGDGEDVGVARGLDVVNHVADVDEFCGVQGVLGEECGDVGFFIHDACMEGFKEMMDAEGVGLRLDGLGGCGTEHEHATGFELRLFQEGERCLQNGDGFQGGGEGAAEFNFQFFQGNVG